MNEELYQKMWQIFKMLGETAFVMNHYDLAKNTEIKEAPLWKLFLMEPDVANYINTEINIIKNAELNKMLKDIGSSKSVGQAQLMVALSKLNEGTAQKDGPIFIYTYVPLSPDQAQATNVQQLQEDIFLRRG